MPMWKWTEIQEVLYAKQCVKLRHCIKDRLTGIYLDSIREEKMGVVPLVANADVAEAPKLGEV